jgi:hypothetical protein
MEAKGHTFAPKPSSEIQEAAMDAFRRRGCPVRKWNVVC